MVDYSAVNRAMWDDRAPAHAAAPEYAVEQFVADPELLSDVVRFDLPRLGDLRGLRGAHLQCHIGTDTVSLARLGARMTGLDFSPAALAEARRLAERTGSDIDFVEADLYDAVQLLGARGLRPGVHRHRRPVLAARRRSAGPRWWRPCCGRAGGCSCARGTRCCGPWTTRARTGCSRWSYPYVEQPDPDV